MEKKVQCIMLIDDNKIDNFFHERVIKKYDAASTVVSKESGREALDYLIAHRTAQQPQLIFLDINMPGMNGWEFIEEYKRLDLEIQKTMIVIMLTISEDPNDKSRAKMHGLLSDFRNKPLTQDMLGEVIEKYYTNKE